MKKFGFRKEIITCIIIFLMAIIPCWAIGKETSENKKTIYISQKNGFDENNDGSIVSKPIRTISRAYEIAKFTKQDFDEFEILLKGGETFNEHKPVGVDLYGNGKKNTYAFVWNIDKKLTISTYGPSEKAHLYGGKHTHEGGPVQAILIISPSSKEVLIENLYFEMWEVGTIMLFETEDIHIRNIKIDKVGPYFFPEEKIEGVYCAGVVYPKNSTRVLIEDIVMTNCHNNYGELGALHGFYCTRLNHSEIRNCYLKNVSGSPFKFRRSPANNVYVHNNKCYYTGVSAQTPDQVQFGFVRYSGDKKEGCPHSLVFENNIFHYPYCWSELGEDCTNAKAVKYSISNTTVCGKDACEKPENIKWINNDFKYQWEPENISQTQILDCIEVDSVTGDFPVSFAFIEKDQQQFIAYYNKSRHMTVASRKTPDKKWNYKVLPTKVGWDTHNRITMAIDRDNCIHVTGNMHNDSMTYFITERPYDVSSFRKIFPLVAEEDELSSTYPSFIKTPDGKIVFTYRKGGSGNGITITSEYNEQCKSFKRLAEKPMFDGLNEMSAYFRGPTLGPDGKYHLTWLWRNTPHCETNHDLSYAVSEDLVNWKTIVGRQIDLPITPHKIQFTVDPVPPKGGVINGAHTLFFLKDNTPVLAYMKYDKDGNNQYYLAAEENGKWEIKQISNWNYRWEFSGPGSIDFQIKLKNAGLADDNQVKIEYWHVNRGHGELIVDANSFQLIEDRKVEPVAENKYPTELMEVNRKDGKFQVHFLRPKSYDNSVNGDYVLRWETMGKRRYYKAPEIPVKPSVLKLYKLNE